MAETLPIESAAGPRPMPAPDAAAIALARRALAPWRWLTAPAVYGIDSVPLDRPVMFAGNHTLLGLLDVPVMLLELYERLGMWPRPLGDHVHFGVPGWRTLLERYGTIEGTREGCRELMRAGASILVFPGGAREVFKRRGERYQLLWDGRTGFARLAIEHGYPIVPFAAVGAEECYDILLDAGDLRRLIPALRWVKRSDEAPPLVRGVGPTILPRPQRFYFHFGTPVETRHLSGLEDRACGAVRDQVRAAVETGIAFLLHERERDPQRSLVQRLLAA
jgi:1-acyl-sn-glycerol-3-phosphate acyltransferase